MGRGGDIGYDPSEVDDPEMIDTFYPEDGDAPRIPSSPDDFDLSSLYDPSTWRDPEADPNIYQTGPAPRIPSSPDDFDMSSLYPYADIAGTGVDPNAHPPTLSPDEEASIEMGPETASTGGQAPTGGPTVPSAPPGLPGGVPQGGQASGVAQTLSGPQETARPPDGYPAGYDLTPEERRQADEESWRRTVETANPPEGYSDDTVQEYQQGTDVRSVGQAAALRVGQETARRQATYLAGQQLELQRQQRQNADEDARFAAEQHRASDVMDRAIADMKAAATDVDSLFPPQRGFTYYLSQGLLAASAGMGSGVAANMLSMQVDHDSAAQEAREQRYKLRTAALTDASLAAAKGVEAIGSARQASSAAFRLRAIAQKEVLAQGIQAIAAQTKDQALAAQYLDEAGRLHQAAAKDRQDLLLKQAQTAKENALARKAARAGAGGAGRPGSLQTGYYDVLTGQWQPYPAGVVLKSATQQDAVSGAGLAYENVSRLSLELKRLSNEMDSARTAGGAAWSKWKTENEYRYDALADELATAIAKNDDPQSVARESEVTQARKNRIPSLESWSSGGGKRSLVLADDIERRGRDRYKAKMRTLGVDLDGTAFATRREENIEHSEPTPPPQYTQSQLDEDARVAEDEAFKAPTRESVAAAEAAKKRAESGTKDLASLRREKANSTAASDDLGLRIDRNHGIADPDAEESLKIANNAYREKLALLPDEGDVPLELYNSVKSAKDAYDDAWDRWRESLHSFSRD